MGWEGELPKDVHDVRWKNRLQVRTVDGQLALIRGRCPRNYSKRGKPPSPILTTRIIKQPTWWDELSGAATEVLRALRGSSFL